MVAAYGQQVARGIAPGPIQGVRLADGRWVGGSYFWAAALIPDHPMAQTWLDTAAKYVRYKLAMMTAPGGTWGELIYGRITVGERSRATA